MVVKKKTNEKSQRVSDMEAGTLAGMTQQTLKRKKKADWEGDIH